VRRNWIRSNCRPDCPAVCRSPLAPSAILLRAPDAVSPFARSLAPAPPPHRPRCSSANCARVSGSRRNGVRIDRDLRKSNVAFPPLGKMVGKWHSPAAGPRSSGSCSAWDCDMRSSAPTRKLLWASAVGGSVCCCTTGS